jgi:hypothetical protein
VPSTDASEPMNELSINSPLSFASPAKTRTEPERTSTVAAAMATTSNQNNPNSQD